MPMEAVSSGSSTGEPPLDLDVVIVSHGSESLLAACLASLSRYPSRARSRVTVVDSGSPDSTPEMVERDFPEVRLVRLGNVGFSAANNVVLCDPQVASCILLLNPDTEVLEGTLDRSLERLHSDPGIGMVGCRLILPGGELDHACKRAFPTPLSAIGHFSGVGRLPGAPPWLSQYRATHLDADESGDVDAVNGAFMLVRREALQAVGPLDAGYWLYMEDLDWCARFWERGWRVFYESEATAIHVKGGSSGSRRKLRQEVAFHRGMGRFYRRFDAPGKPALINAIVYAGIGAKLAVTLAITRTHKLLKRT